MEETLLFIMVYRRWMKMLANSFLPEWQTLVVACYQKDFTQAPIETTATLTAIIIIPSFRHLIKDGMSLSSNLFTFTRASFTSPLSKGFTSSFTRESKELTVSFAFLTKPIF